ncbi:MAG TPA: DUF3459 domain-containing protein, partial [Burkholderiaceae bacterium]
RRRARHAMLACLLLAQGTPMLCAGDEIGNSQQGNNNAYCQDNATSWLAWAEADAGTLELVRELLALRRQEPLLRNAKWFADASIAWFNAAGHAMQAADWHADGSLGFAAQLQDAAAAAPRLMLIFNPEPEARSFALPRGPWTLLLDSSAALPAGPLPGTVQIPSRALLVLRNSTAS